MGRRKRRRGLVGFRIRLHANGVSLRVHGSSYVVWAGRSGAGGIWHVSVVHTNIRFLSINTTLHCPHRCQAFPSLTPASDM